MQSSTILQIPIDHNAQKVLPPQVDEFELYRQKRDGRAGGKKGAGRPNDLTSHESELMYFAIDFNLKYLTELQLLVFRKFELIKAAVLQERPRLQYAIAECREQAAKRLTEAQEANGESPGTKAKSSALLELQEEHAVLKLTYEVIEKIVVELDLHEAFHSRQNRHDAVFAREAIKQMLEGKMSTKLGLVKYWQSLRLKDIDAKHKQMMSL